MILKIQAAPFTRLHARSRGFALVSVPSDLQLNEFWQGVEDWAGVNADLVGDLLQVIVLPGNSSRFQHKPSRLRR